MHFTVEDRRDWTIPWLLRTRAQEHGDRPLLSCAGAAAPLSFGDADRLSDRLAAGLHELGVGPGDCTLLMMGNRIEFVLTWFALSKLGAGHAPVNVDYRGSFLEHVANVSRARTIVLEARFLPTVVASAGQLPLLEQVVVVDPPADADPGPLRMVPFADAFRDAAPPAVDVGRFDPYAVMFTSGSTGRSKGASMTQAHGHLLTERNNALLDMTADGVYLSELPLFHINAHMTVHGALLAGGRAHLEPSFSASRWLQRVRDSGATHTSMLGVMVDFVQRQPPTDGDHDHLLRGTWMVPCVPNLAEGFRERFGVARVVTSYGTTETGMLASRVVRPGTPASAGGVAEELYEVQLVDPEGESVAPGEAGEIVARPRIPGTIVRGYLGAPEQTVEAFRDLWFHTGDVGRIDEDGHLVFLDRLQDRIRRRGENVASADLEHVLGSHPHVAEVAVVAVTADEAGGEDEIKACVVTVEGAAFDADAFWAWCDERLPYFAVPRYVQLLDALPKTPTAKVTKHVLRDAGLGGETVDRGPTGRAGRR